METPADLVRWLQAEGWALHRRARHGSYWKHPRSHRLLLVSGRTKGRADRNAKATARRLVRPMDLATQPVCDDCWDLEEPRRTPARLPMAERTMEHCARCGRETWSGIYVQVLGNVVRTPPVEGDG